MTKNLQSHNYAEIKDSLLRVPLLLSALTLLGKLGNSEKLTNTLGGGGKLFKNSESKEDTIQ